jgi:hypothetical protein
LPVEKSFSRTDGLVKPWPREPRLIRFPRDPGRWLGTRQPARVRVTTWNLEWFPSGSAHDATPEVQGQRIAAAADVLRPIDADIILLQEVRDYEACARLGEAIAPGMYHVAICSAFKEPFQRGLGKQQVAILSKYQAQAAWSEPWKSMNGVDPPWDLWFSRRHV